MGKPAISRREVLRLGAVTAAAIGGVGAGTGSARAASADKVDAPITQAATDAGAYEVLANAYGFGVDIPGAPRSSKNILGVDIDELVWDDDAARLRPSTVTLSFGFDPAARPELQAWVDQASKGGQARPRNITLSVFRKDGRVGRGLVLIDCRPVEWAAADFSPTSTVQTEKLRVKVGYIEFQAL